MIKGLAEALQKAETLADKVYWILIYEGQYNHKFHLGETIMNNPAEVRDLVEKYSDILIEEREKTADEYRKWLIGCLHKYGHDELISIVCPYGEDEMVKAVLPDSQTHKALSAMDGMSKILNAIWN